MGALLLLGLIEVVAGSVAAYIIGRILLPEVGLTAPGFWIWFWVMVVVAILDFIKGVIKEVSA